MKTTKQLILQKSRALDAREKEETEEEEERDEEQEEEKEEEEEEAEEEEEDGRAKRLILKLDLGKRAARGQFQLPFLQSISIFSKRNSWSEKYKQKTQQEKSKSKISNHHIWYQNIYIFFLLLLLLFNPSGGATEEIGRGEEKRKEKKKKMGAPIGLGMEEWNRAKIPLMAGQVSAETTGTKGRIAHYSPGD